MTTTPMIKTGERRSRVRDEDGIVLLMVLIIVALLTVIVTEFTYSVQIDQHRVRNSMHQLQASLLARSGINIAEAFLAQDKERRYDAETEEWWQRLQEYQHEELVLDPTTRLAIAVVDETGKININATRTTPDQRRREGIPTKDDFFRTAMKAIFQKYDIDVETVDTLKEFWLQERTDEDGKAIRVPGFPSLEDFAAAFDIPTSKLRHLRPLLTAIPSPRRLRIPTTININTAPVEVLTALLYDNPAALDPILSRRGEDPPFENTGQIKTILREAVDDARQAQVLGSIFTVRSSLFRLRASALANVDPEGEALGGIGQTLSVLEQRRADARFRRPDDEGPGWTFRPLDWQKESGASLFAKPTEGLNESDSNDLEDASRRDFDTEFLDE